MKTLLTLALALVALTAFIGPSVAQEKKAGEKSPPTGVETKQPAPGATKAKVQYRCDCVMVKHGAKDRPCPTKWGDAEPNCWDDCPKLDCVKKAIEDHYVLDNTKTKVEQKKR